MPAVPPIDRQADYWDRWNAAARSDRLPPASQRQADEAEAAVRAFGQQRELRILDVGCGTGWLCQRLAQYGEVTGTDMTANVIARASERLPKVKFVCGDFFEVALPLAGYDVITSLEVLSHVGEQAAFVRRLAGLLRPGGLLVLSTQNRVAYRLWSAVAQADPAQLRHWVDASSLRRLLRPHFSEVRIKSVNPVGDRGFLRVVNAPKVDRAISAVIGAERLLRWKERALLGGTLIALARR